MKQDDPQFKLRIPADLKIRLDEEAARNTRTLGAEIVARLQNSLQGAPSEAMALLEQENEALRREVELRLQAAAAREELVKTQGALIVALEGHVIDLAEQLPKEKMTQKVRKLVETCNYDLAIERALDDPNKSHPLEVAIKYATTSDPLAAKRPFAGLDRPNILKPKAEGFVKKRDSGKKSEYLKAVLKGGGSLQEKAVTPEPKQNAPGSARKH